MLFSCLIPWAGALVLCGTIVIADLPVLLPALKSDSSKRQRCHVLRESLASPGTEAQEKCPQAVPTEEMPCDILFPSASLEIPFAVPQEGGGETWSTWLSLQEQLQQDAKESRGGRGGGSGRGRSAAGAQTPFRGRLRPGANSGVGGRGCREGLLSHPSASNSPILGWWLPKGGTIVDSG